MPTKMLDSQAGRGGVQKTFKYGGGANTVFANDDGVSDFGYIINGGGGNDTIFGSDFFRLVPDPDNEGEFLIDGGDLLIGGDGDDMIFGGAGNDVIYGGHVDPLEVDSSKGQNDPPTNILVGDGERLVADPSLSSEYTADVSFINDATEFNGGDDTVIGGAGATLNSIYGDAADVDMLVAGLTFNGGDDELIGGSGPGTNSMFGDAADVNIVGGSTFNGGDDTLRAGDGANNTMIGDAGILESGGAGTANGGDDTLISGSGDDTMIGDFGAFAGFDGTINGGSDTFVFLTIDHGFDSIGDFEVDVDQIDISATGLSFGDLDSNNNFILDDADIGVTVNLATNTTQIVFTDVVNGTEGSFGDLLTISNVIDLAASDFV